MSNERSITQYFQPILGLQPWKVKLGVGSFLTFEFGSKIKAHGFIHGQWHLWIYMAGWQLLHGSRCLADSDADRRVIQVSIRRLEQKSLIAVDFDSNSKKTSFTFDDFRLKVSPLADMDGLDDRDYYWMFFKPDNEVVTVGPAGVQTGQADAVQHA